MLTHLYFKNISTASRHLVVLRDINIYFAKGFASALKNEKIDIVEFAYPAGIVAAKSEKHTQSASGAPVFQR